MPAGPTAKMAVLLKSMLRRCCRIVAASKGKLALILFPPVQRISGNVRQRFACGLTETRTLQGRRRGDNRTSISVNCGSLPRLQFPLVVHESWQKQQRG